jgi:putative FmdB family regulatory protein
MPMYDYQCKKCGHFEIYQSIKDDALKKCPTCKSKVERLISANVGFVLKGSGFYQNDYKNNGSSKGKSKSAADKLPKPSEVAPKVESKPDCSKCPGPDVCGT